MIQEQQQIDIEQPQNQPDPTTEKKKQQQQQIEVKSLNHLSLYHTYFQRYYTTYQSKNQYIHLHTNGLFIVRPKLCNLPSKPVNVEYLLQPVQVKGKKKRGGVRVKPNTNLAKIKCSNGEIVKITSCVEGTIIQHNTNVKVQQFEKDQSYLVIILPSRRFIPEQAGMQKVTYIGNPFKK